MHSNGVATNGSAACCPEAGASPAREGHPWCGGREIVVGYAFMAKKLGSMGKVVQGTSVTKQEEEQGPRVVFKALDLDRPLEEQAPIDLILHKLSEDVMLRYVQGASARRVQALESYVARHPEVALIEHPRHIEKIVSRAETCRVLKRLCEERPGTAVRPPRFVVVEAPVDHRGDLSAIVARAPFSYPIICKPVAACGSAGSHRLIVVGNEEGLDLVPTPVVLQEFCNHDGVLFKVYVLGDHIQVFRRNSLPNLGPNVRNLVFDSQQPYPSGRDFGTEEGGQAQAGAAGWSRGELNEDRDPKTPISGDSDGHSLGGKQNGAGPRVSEQQLRLAAAQLSEAFQLEIFGFDVIVDKATGDLVVVDVNYFPSFKEIPDFAALLRAFLRRKALAKASELARRGPESHPPAPP